MQKNNLKPKFYKSFRSRKKYDVTNNLNIGNKRISEILRNNKKINLEIGFGDGESVIYMAKNNPKKNFICIESYVIGIKNLYKKIQKENLNNILIVHGDAIEFLEEKIKKYSISRLYIFFPDPWPKRKHKKRRIINKYTVNLIMDKLVNNGLLHFTTDNINYAYETRSLLQNFFKEKRNVNFCNHRGDRPITKYEEKAIAKKNLIFDILVYS